MNHTTRRIAIVLTALVCIPPAAAEDPLNDERLVSWQRADIKVFREKFLALDRSFSAAARAAAEARLSSMETAEQPLSPAQFAIELCQITALADNAHTQCLPGSSGRHICERFAELLTDDSPWCNLRDSELEPPDFSRLPLSFYPFGEEFHVVRVHAEHADLLGARLISVDDRPIERMRAMLRKFAGGTTAHRDEVAAEVLASPQQLHAVELSRAQDSVLYEFETRDGNRVRRKVSLSDNPTNWRRIPPADRTPWSLQEPEKPFRYRDAPEIDSLVVQLRQILDAEEQTIAAFLESAETQRATLGRRNIVLDMRANGGGNLLLARDFMIEWPTRISGRFYVLTSRQTFSAAITSIAYLKQAGADRVVIIGEPVGDRLMFFSDGLPVQLPHSGLFFLPAVVRMDYADGCRAYNDCFEGVAQPGGPAAESLLRLPPGVQRQPLSVGTLKPDVLAPWTVDSMIDGTDPAMDAVKEMVGERRRKVQN